MRMTSAPALLAARAAERPEDTSGARYSVIKRTVVSPEGPPPTTSTSHLSCTGMLLAGSSTTSLSSSISASLALEHSVSVLEFNRTHFFIDRHQEPYDVLKASGH